MASSYISLRHIVAMLKYVKNKKPRQNNTVLVGFLWRTALFYICRLSKYPPNIALAIIGNITINNGENPVASETKPTKSCT